MVIRTVFIPEAQLLYLFYYQLISFREIKKTGARFPDFLILFRTGYRVSPGNKKRQEFELLSLYQSFWCAYIEERMCSAYILKPERLFLNSSVSSKKSSFDLYSRLKNGVKSTSHWGR